MSSFFSDHWTKHLFLAHTHLELQLNELALEIYFGLQAGGLQVMFVSFLMSWFTHCNKINMFTIIVYEGILSKLASIKHVLDLGLDLHSGPSGNRVSQHERGWPGRPILPTTFRNRSLQVGKESNQETKLECVYSRARLQRTWLGVAILVRYNR